MEPFWSNLFALLTAKHRVPFLKYVARANQIEVRSIVEIGVFQGRSSVFSECCSPTPSSISSTLGSSPPNTWLTGMPPSKREEEYEEAYGLVRERFAEDPNVQILRVSSEKAAALVPDGLDLVFIDGDHSYEAVKQDIALWSKKVRPGGIISGHDYQETWFPQVVRAVNEMFPAIQLGPDMTWVVQAKG